MTDQEQSAIDQLEEHVEEMHGQRMAVSMQKTRELSPKEAVKAQAEADTLRRILNAIAHVRNGNEIHDDTREYYVDLSRAMRTAEQSAADAQSEPEELRGLQ